MGTATGRTSSVRPQVELPTIPTTLVKMECDFRVRTEAVSVDFFGVRRFSPTTVYSLDKDPYDRTHRLDDLAKKVVEVAHACFRSGELAENERVAGLECVRRLRTFYEITDKQIKKSNCLTRILVWVREKFGSGARIRSLIEDTTKDSLEQMFLSYSPERFLKTFDRPAYFQHIRGNLACAGELRVELEDDRLPKKTTRILAKEEFVRELVLGATRGSSAARAPSLSQLVPAG